MLASIFGFIRDMAWELVVLQMNPFLGLMLLAVAGIGAGAAVWLMRR
jgi:hypothetical protein